MLVFTLWWAHNSLKVRQNFSCENRILYFEIRYLAHRIQPPTAMSELPSILSDGHVENENNENGVNPAQDEVRQ